MSTVIPVAIPLLGEEEAAQARRVILSGWVTQGPEVARFESEFAALVGARHARAVSSCTAALHMALVAVGVGPGDEVVTVSHSFVATANAVRYCGALPVFVDITPGDWNMDPAGLKRAITAKTKAVLCVHQLGMPANMAAILAVTKPLGLPVVEDAACAIGSAIDMGQGFEPIGKPHGDIACFSFHPRKVITTGDGGMLTTNNPEYDHRFTLLRQHGMSVSDLARHGASSIIYESYPEVGYNYRMTDIQAAVGRVQLTRLPGIIARRRELAARYMRELGGQPGDAQGETGRLGMPVEPAYCRSNWQSFCVRLPAGTNQRAVLQFLLDNGVSARRGVMCAHRELPRGEAWTCAERQCECQPGACAALAESERAQDGTIILPLYPQMTDDDQTRVIETLRKALGANAPGA